MMVQWVWRKTSFGCLVPLFIVYAIVRLLLTWLHEQPGPVYLHREPNLDLMLHQGSHSHRENPEAAAYTDMVDTFANYSICHLFDQLHLADIPRRPHNMQEVLSSLGDQPELFLFAAYFDDRGHIEADTANLVQVTGMMHRDKLDSLAEIHCTLWYEGIGKGYSVKGKGFTIWKYQGPYQAVMVTCPIPLKRATPRRVTLTTRKCDAPTNALEIVINSFSRRSEQVAVCAKVIYSKPDPIRLVEWIELNKLLGADAIYMYNTSLEGVVNDVLMHYTRMGTVTLKQHDFLNHMSHVAYNQSFPTFHYQYNWELEIMSMTDCLYTSHERYLVNIDIDEIMHPHKYASFIDLVNDWGFAESPKVASLVFHTGVFTNEFGVDSNNSAPEYLHTMRHTTRTAIDWESPKSLVHADRCLGLAHHICMVPRPGFRHRAEMPEQHGYVRHYRQECRLTGEPNKCEKLMKHPVHDLLLHKYLKQLDNNVKPVLEKFKLL